MADYHPLIARAVEGLANNTAEARRTLYERARAALVAQLRGIDPPLSEAEITRERLALEDSIRKVEADAVRKARSEPRPAAPRSIHATNRPYGGAAPIASPAAGARGRAPPLHGLAQGYDLDDQEQLELNRHQPQRSIEPVEHYRKSRPPRSYRGLAKLAAVLVIVAGLGAMVSWQWPNISGLYQFLTHMR